MKYKKALAFAASFIGTSLLSSATFAGSIDNFNVITDPKGTTQASSGYQYTSTFSFEHNQAQQVKKTSVEIDNPAMFDGMPLVLSISIACAISVSVFAIIFCEVSPSWAYWQGFLCLYPRHCNSFGLLERQFIKRGGR